MQIPYDKISSDTLTRIIESFVLREGTDYGPKEFSLEEKVIQVKKQLVVGDACVVFNPEDETCNIVRKTDNSTKS